jgi:hypothetical protein
MRHGPTFRDSRQQKRDDAIQSDYAGLDYFVSGWGCSTLWSAVAVYATIGLLFLVVSLPVLFVANFIRTVPALHNRGLDHQAISLIGVPRQDYSFAKSRLVWLIKSVGVSSVGPHEKPMIGNRCDLGRCPGIAGSFIMASLMGAQRSLIEAYFVTDVGFWALDYGAAVEIKIARRTVHNHFEVFCGSRSAVLPKWG